MTYVRYVPTISFSNYIDIKSVVGAGNQVSNRVYCLRLMTTNPLLPPQSYIEESQLSAVGQYFGTSSIEYARAKFYLGWVNKNGNLPTLISFARWVNADTAPYIIGAQSTQSVGLYTSITNGSFSMTIGGVTNNFTGLDFTACVTLSDVASIIQTAINAASGTQWTAATVTWDAVHGSFDFKGGSAVVAQISVANYSTGTPILSILGWLTGAIVGYGSLTETITDTLQATYAASNNFGSVIFIPDLNLSQDTEASAWADELDVEACYWPRATLANTLTNAAALANYSGTGLTVSDVSEESGIGSVSVITAGNYVVTPTVVLAGDGSGAGLAPHLTVVANSFAPVAHGSGYAAGDTILFAGGTHTAQLQATVGSTRLVSFTVSGGGTGFDIGDTITFTGGTFATAAQLTVDTVNGSGAILTAHISVVGSYTVNTSGSTYTTSGVGSGATFSALSYGENALTFINPGDYTVLPANPVSQASSSGGGTGLTGNVHWQVSSVVVITPGEGYIPDSTLALTGGSPDASVSLVLQNNPVSFAEQAPAMIFAATNYNTDNSVQNYMFQVFNLTPSVNDDATKSSLDQARVNYYGQTQQAGALKAFYQTGVMFGPSDLPTDMNTFTNEIWLKDSIGVTAMNLLLGLSNLPANTKGLALFSSAVQPVLNQALSNGVISAGNTFTPNDIAYITQVTNNPNAWRQVQSKGYWFNPVITPYTGDDNLQHYSINYVLVYGKNNAVRKVTGTDIQI